MAAEKRVRDRGLVFCQFELGPKKGFWEITADHQMF